MGRVARSERTKSQLRAEARGVRRARQVMAKPAPAPARKPVALKRKFNAPKKTSRQKVRPLRGKSGSAALDSSVFGPARKPIVERAMRKENRKALKEITKPKRVFVPKRLPKYVGAPSQFRWKPSPGVTEARGEPSQMEVAGRKKAPSLFRLNDPITKPAKREQRQRERDAVDRLIRPEVQKLRRGVAKPTSKNVRTANESVQQLRDLGVVSGRSRSRRAQREEDRQVARLMRQRVRKDRPGDKALNDALKIAGDALSGNSKAAKLSNDALARRVEQNRPVNVAGVNVGRAAKILNENRNSTTAAALVLANQLTRVSSAEGEAAYQGVKAFKKTKNVKKAGEAAKKGFGKGFVGNKSGWSKVLRELGASRATAGVLGFVGDVALDPTTYVTFGLGSAGRAAVRAAGARAIRKAAAAGAPKAVQLERAREAMDAAAKSMARSRASAAALRSQEDAASSSAIKAQRRQLADLEKAGRGNSRKAQNIRRNIESAGKRRSSRVARAEGKAQGAQERFVAFDRASKGGTKAPRRRFQPGVVRRKMRGAKTEAQARWADMAVKDAERGRPGVRPPAAERRGTAVTVGFGKRKVRVLDTSKKPFGGYRTGKAGNRAGNAFRPLLAEVAPEVRSTAEIPITEAAGRRRAERVMRAERNRADNEARLLDDALATHVGQMSERDNATWKSIYERGGRVRRLPDGSFAYVQDADGALVGVSKDFVDRHVARSGRRYVLKEGKRVSDAVNLARRRLQRQGQPVGDAMKVKVVRDSDVAKAKASLEDARAARKQAAAELSAARKKARKLGGAGDKAAYEAANKEVVAAEKRLAAARESVKTQEKAVGKLEKEFAIRDSDPVAKQYLPRRPVVNADSPYAKQVEYVSVEGEATGAGSRGSLKKRKDPRPVDIGNAEMLTNGRSKRPLMSNDIQSDVATDTLNKGRVTAFAAGANELAKVGKTIRFKSVGEESIDDFYARHKIDPEEYATGQAAQEGQAVYQLAVRGEEGTAGRYDLYELGPDEIDELVTGKTFDGQPSKLTARGKGQFVMLDRRTVNEFRTARTSEVLSGNEVVRLYDRVSAGLRRLAISTPMYQAINEMGDTWIMFTVVPAYKIPYYKAKALPVVRYVQAREAGKEAAKLGRKAIAGDGVRNGSAKELGNAEIFMGDGYMRVRDIAREIEREGGMRQGIYARIVDMTNPEVRAATLGERGGIRKLTAPLTSNEVGLTPKGVAANVGYVPKALGRTFRSREDWSRVATYMYLRDQGLGKADSAQTMLNALIDYGELSKAERDIARRLAFFYTFPARQIPYQTKAFLRRPGKLAAYEKLRQAAAYSQGINLDSLKDQPWYVQANVPIPMRFNGQVYWVSANLPFNMLNQSVPLGVNFPPTELLSNDVRFMIASLNPLVRSVIENPKMGLNQNVFFRQPIKSDNYYEDNLTPAPWYVVQAVKAAPGLRKLTGLQQGTVRSSGGKKIWLMDTSFAWAMGQISFGPLRPLAELGKFRNQRGMSQAESLFKFFTGIRADRDKSLDQKIAELSDKIKIYTQTQKRLDTAGSKGSAVYERNKKRIKLLEEARTKLSKERGDMPAIGEREKTGKPGPYAAFGVQSGGTRSDPYAAFGNKPKSSGSNDPYGAFK